jgi:hypothetical protein
MFFVAYKIIAQWVRGAIDTLKSATADPVVTTLTSKIVLEGIFPPPGRARYMSSSRRWNSPSIDRLVVGGRSPCVILLAWKFSVGKQYRVLVQPCISCSGSELA